MTSVRAPFGEVGGLRFVRLNHVSMVGRLRSGTDIGLVNEVVADLEATGEPIADRRFSGKFTVRVPESLHRELVHAAAEEGVSLNRLISDRLARS